MCIYIYFEHSLSIKTVKSKDQDKHFMHDSIEEMTIVWI
jgi:bacterioferritin (cytochrome b1)